MIAPRWRKVWRDLGDKPLRTTLAILALAAGTFGIGASLTRYSILHRELEATYAATRPASAILHLASVDDSLAVAARAVPGVADAEVRPVIAARVRVGDDEWAPVVLFVIRDFGDLRLDTFSPDQGSWPPDSGEVLIERSSLSVARAGIGDELTVRTAEGEDRPLRIAGTVHAAGLAPGWMDHVVSGFVSWDCIARTAGHAEGGQLRIAVAEDRLNEQHIREVAAGVRAALEARGIDVRRVEIPAPGRHPHADQMDTFLFLLAAFGVLTVLLSSVLVANMVHALMAEQVREVGMMKAIGASDRQVAALYVGQVSILATAALAVGTPLGIAAGRGYARFSASMLNATISNESVPLWVLLAQTLVGLGVPLAIASVPVLRASRITVQDAFSNGLVSRPFGTRSFDRWLSRIRILPRPLMLSLRAAFHRRGRLTLTVGMLSVGGAAFIAALNVAAAWDRALQSDADARRYDVDVRFASDQPIERVRTLLESIPQVARAEFWPDAGALLVEPDGAAETRLPILGPEPETPLLAFPMLSGRWLTRDDTDAAVVNQNMIAMHPWLGVGKPLTLEVGGKRVTWTLVGVTEEMGPHVVVYASRRQVLEASGRSPHSTRGARIVTREHDASSQVAVSRALERTLSDAGIAVTAMQSLADRRQAVADHLVIIESALAAAATLVALVGGLALSASLSLSVLERRREIGILSAIGASPGAISTTVVIEALLTALLSCVAAAVLAVPATLALNQVAGQMFRRAGLPFYMSPGAVGAWLLFALVLAAVASFYPAWQSIRLPVREALTYE